MPGVARPSALPTRERPRRHRSQHQRAGQEELGVGKAAAAEQDRRRQSAPSRADREAHARPDEGRREGEVREIAGRQVHGEEAGEQPGQDPRGARARAFSGQRSRRPHEHGGHRADHAAERGLEPGGHRGERQVQGPGKDREQRRAPRPLADDREALGRAEACPPQVRRGYPGRRRTDSRGAGTERGEE